jgi:hypothetical protein
LGCSRRAIRRASASKRSRKGAGVEVGDLIGAQHLDRDLAAEQQIGAEEDLGEAALPDQPIEPETPVEDRAGVGHRSPLAAIVVQLPLCTMRGA